MFLELGTKGTLHEYKKRICDCRLSEEIVVQKVMWSTCSAVAYLHSRGIAHRDIKPENLLVSVAGCKLADFGFAVDTHKVSPCVRLGTLEYMAPEILRCDKQARAALEATGQAAYGMAVDNWALGVLAHECLLGVTPFFRLTNKETVKRILKFSGRLDMLDGLISPEAADFITRALNPNPVKRMTAAEMMEHPWLLMHSTVPRGTPVGQAVVMPTRSNSF